MQHEWGKRPVRGWPTATPTHRLEKQNEPSHKKYFAHGHIHQNNYDYGCTNHDRQVGICMRCNAPRKVCGGPITLAANVAFQSDSI